ncbi:MAG TPA: hypothetical protein VL402_09530 [Xanthobacteraceae bacterium]|jgi:hypothetical protein|nr:hypothetical protein [Xanthobacteraceae bacterium]
MDLVIAEGAVGAELPFFELVVFGVITMISSIVVVFKEQLRPFRDLSKSLLFSVAPPLKPVSSGSRTSGGSRMRPYTTGSVKALPLRLQDCHPHEWDALAQECGASFHSAHARLWGWSLKTRFRQRLEIFEFSQSGQKIGQCAVGVSAAERVFLDRLALKPGSELLWTDCMAAVLARLGPGHYRYGWHLTLEQGREEDLQSLPGVTVESVRPLIVQAVDFRRWSSWDEYWASTSSNTRRNAKRGEKTNLRVAVRTGFACLLHVVAITRLRSVMYKRKEIEFHHLRALASYVGGHLAAPQYRFAAIASGGKQPLAGFIGYEFGAHTYYIAGGSRRSNNGAAWYLQKRMLQRAWERSGGRAKFVMGYVDYAIHDEAVGGGLLRSRRSVNASDYETSVVTFRYEQP